MAEIAPAAALCLAVVFAWAGASKLVRGDLTAAGFRALRVPAPAVTARLLPLIELGVAAALVVAPRAGAVLALLLLAAFTVFLARAMASGVTVGCGCFGATRAEPVSAVDLGRNALLLAGAAVATGSTGPGWPTLPALVLTSMAAMLAVVALAAARTRAKLR